MVFFFTLPPSRYASRRSVHGGGIPVWNGLNVHGSPIWESHKPVGKFYKFTWVQFYVKVMPDNMFYQRVTRKNEGGKGLNFGLDISAFSGNYDSRTQETARGRGINERRTEEQQGPRTNQTTRFRGEEA